MIGLKIRSRDKGPALEVKTRDQEENKIGFVISDVLTDVMILIIPLPIVWKLQMSTKNKVGLSGVFLLGLL